MKVDHINQLYKNGEDEIDNYNPACRMCNFYKSTFGIEDFRGNIKSIKERLRKVFIYRLAVRYGIVEEKNKNVRFYFEMEENNER